MSSQLCLQLLLKNVGKDKLLTDISNINYTSGEKLLSEQSISSNSISEPFCDSIKLAQICENSQWNEQYSHECQNYLIDKFFKVTATQPNFSAEPSREAPVPLYSNSQSVNAVWDIIRGKAVIETFSDPVCVFYGVTFENVELKQLLRGNPNILQILEKENYFLVELHISQDFAGIFNKTEMCDHLLKNFKFCYDDDDNELRNDYNVIRKEETGIDNITWKSSNTEIQIYNKFVSQLTNPGACNKIGNRIIDFIDPSNKQLQKAFSSRKAKEHGITALKLTIYNHENEGFKKTHEPSTDCLRALEINKIYLEEEDAPMYSVSMAKMWQKLTDVLQNSCCVVYDNLLQFAYWGNSCTEQFTGVQIEQSVDPEEQEDQINYALSQFSFNNLPVNYLNVLPKKKQIIQKRFQKSGETFFTSSDKLRQTIPFDVDIAGAGLIETNHVIPEVLRKFKPLPRIHSIMEIKPMFLVCESIYPVSAPNSQEVELQLDDLSAAIQGIAISAEENEKSMTAEETIKSSNHLTSPNRSEPVLDDISNAIGTMSIQNKENEAEEQAMVEFAERLSQELNELRLDDTNLSVALVEEITVKTEENEKETIKKTKFELLDYFKEKHWKNLESADAYEIFGFTVKRKGMNFHVGILASKKNKDDKAIYHLKGPLKDRFIRCHSKTEFLTQQSYIVSNANNLKIIHLALENPFAEFQTNGTESFQGNLIPKIEHLKFYTDDWKNYDDSASENLILEETRESLYDLFSWRNWKNLDQNGEYQVYAFTVNEVVEFPCVGVLAKEKNTNSKHVYFVKGIAKLHFMNRYHDRHKLEKIDHAIYSCNNLEIVYLENEQLLAEFKTNGMDSYKTYKFPKVENIRFFSITSSQYEDIKPQVLEEERLSFEETQDQLSTLFRRRNWKFLNQNGEYVVCAFTVAEDLKYPCVGVLAKEKNDDSKHVYAIEWKNTEEFKVLYRHRNLLIMEKSYDMIKFDESDVMFLGTKLPLAKFKTIGIDSQDGDTFPMIEDLHFYK